MLVPLLRATTQRLFQSPAELAAFRERHAHHRAVRAPFAEARGPVFVGIDSGSTTTKLVVTDTEGRLLHTYYAAHMACSMPSAALCGVYCAVRARVARRLSNPAQGDTLGGALAALRDMYAHLPAAAHTAACTATGYGEGLLRAALRADGGMVETVCHLRAAQHFLPGPRAHAHHAANGRTLTGRGGCRGRLCA